MYFHVYLAFCLFTVLSLLLHAEYREELCHMLTPFNRRLQGPRGGRGARGPTGKPGAKVRVHTVCVLYMKKKHISKQADLYEYDIMFHTHRLCLPSNKTSQIMPAHI